MNVLRREKNEFYYSNKYGYKELVRNYVLIKKEFLLQLSIKIQSYFSTILPIK